MIPREVALFLRSPARSLVVKGSAGAGKTLFALAIARWFQLEIGDVLWLNARDAEPAVVSQLDDFVPPEQRIDATQRERADEGPLGSPMALVDDLREELVEGDRTLVVIDSVSALADGASEEERMAFERAITRLARESRSNFVLIVESAAPVGIEYLADGVVSLGEEETPIGRIRVLRSQKLRGAPAALARHPFTLAEGEFWAPDAEDAVPPDAPVRAPARPDTRDRVVTGTNGWDLVLGGGLERGSVLLLEVPDAVGTHEHAFVVPLVLNARALGRDVAMLLPSGVSKAGLEAWVTPHLGTGSRGSMGIMEAGELLQEPLFGDKNATLDERLTRLERLRSRSPGPVVSVLSIDALAAASASEVEVWLARWTHQTRARGHVDVLVSRPEHVGLAVGAAGAHWKLDVWEGRLVARGLAPRTEPLFVRFHSSRGFPETELRRVQ